MSTTNANLHHSRRKILKGETWSDLPPDLVLVISKKLHDICDLIYFWCVCKNWRTFTSVFDLPHQTPWVMEDPIIGDENKCEYRRFYSLFYDKTYTIHCPESRGKTLKGPSHGYICSMDYESIHNSDDPKHSLLNPLTKHEVSHRFRKRGRPIFICMSPRLIEEDDYLTFLDGWATHTLEFYQPHKPSTYYIQGPSCPFFTQNSHACWKGMYLMNIHETGYTMILNIARNSSVEIPCPDINGPPSNVYFVESEGNILRVAMYCDPALEGEMFRDHIYDIYQLDVRNNEYKWMKINDIGNQILFLQDNWSNSSGISITISEYSEFIGNCIYNLQRNGILRYDIKSGRTKIVAPHLSNFSIWFVPSLATNLSE